MNVRVLLADDQALLRATFALLLEATEGIEVVGEASTGSEAVARARETRPDLVLMDIRMPGVDGIEATRQITGDPSLAAVRVLVLTTFETDELVVAALRAGASGYLGKGVEPAALIDAIRTVAAGEALLSPVATTALVGRFLAQQAAPAPPASPPDPPGELTAREREIVALVATGLSNHEIAARLFISPTTAKTHVSRAMSKTGVRDRAQLVVLGYECGLVTPGTRNPNTTRSSS